MFAFWLSRSSTKRSARTLKLRPRRSMRPNNRERYLNDLSLLRSPDVVNIRLIVFDKERK